MFIVGQTYNRRLDIHARYGGQEQGGISTPQKHPYIFLFTADRGEEFGYKDGWSQSGEYLYTGEGQTGDMSFTRGNLAIRDHEQRGKSLHLLKQAGRGNYEYLGEFRCDSWQIVRGIDSRNQSRQVIVFHLLEV